MQEVFLLNRLKEERVLSEMPGTTRDAIDPWSRASAALQDRRHGGNAPGTRARRRSVEFVSVAGAKKAFDGSRRAADRCERRPTDQDAAIGGEADRAGRGLVIVASKWDLAWTATQFVKTFDEIWARHALSRLRAPASYSALTGERTPKCSRRSTRWRIAANARAHPALNKFIENITAANPPVSKERRHVRILRGTVRIAPPVRVLYERRHDIPFLVHPVFGE
jgi:predicted GTPase